MFTTRYGIELDSQLIIFLSNKVTIVHLLLLRFVLYFFLKMHIQLKGHLLDFLPEKALWWPTEKILFISDVHLGKIEHFRLSGIPLPQNAAQQTLSLIIQLLDTYRPYVVYFLGDLFHSVYNNSVEDTLTCFNNYSHIQFVLISGNHDVLQAEVYDRLGIAVLKDLILADFLLTHEPSDILDEGLINLCGHIHPGVRIHGRGRQSLSLPCFYFKKNTMILPAFGYFTGKAIMENSTGAEIYAIGDGHVFKIPSKKSKV